MYLLSKMDLLLNSITMYRLVLYGLGVLSGITIIFGFLGILPFSGIQFTETLVVLSSICYISNKLFSRIFKADTNIESWFITALILFLVLAPIASTTDLIVTIVVGIVAMSSKYFLAFDKKHIFNTAAIAMFLAGLFGFG